MDNDEELSDRKSDYGEIIYENFTFPPDYWKKSTIIATFQVGAFMTVGFSLLLIDLSEHESLSKIPYFNILQKIMGLYFVLFSVYNYWRLVLNRHTHVLFEKGILEPGDWHKKNEFYDFNDIREFYIFPDKETARAIIEPSFIEFRKYEPDRTKWSEARIDDEDLEEELEDISNYIMIVHKPRVSFLKYDYLLIENELFKDIAKFRQEVLPLLKKYKIKIIDNYKE